MPVLGDLHRFEVLHEDRAYGEVASEIATWIHTMLPHAKPWYSSLQRGDAYLIQPNVLHTDVRFSSAADAAIFKLAWPNAVHT